MKFWLFIHKHTILHAIYITNVLKIDCAFLFSLSFFNFIDLYMLNDIEYVECRSMQQYIVNMEIYISILVNLPQC